jgi:hypothetical protein
MATGNFVAKLGTRQTFFYAAAIDISFAVLATFLSVIRTDSDFRNPVPLVATSQKKEN